MDNIKGEACGAGWRSRGREEIEKEDEREENNGMSFLSKTIKKDNREKLKET